MFINLNYVQKNVTKNIYKVYFLFSVFIFLNLYCNYLELNKKIKIKNDKTNINRVNIFFSMSLERFKEIKIIKTKNQK